MPKKKLKSPVCTYKVDCTAPVEDDIIKTEELVEFFKATIKQGGKTGNLGDKIQVNADGTSVKVTNNGGRMAKKYLKYLLKKWLCKQKLRDYIRIIASDKESYKLKYFDVNRDDDEDV